MREQGRLTDNEVVDIVQRWEVELTPAAALAADYSVSRQTIYKALKRAGVDTTKRQIAVSCTACGKEMERPRSRVRERKHLFCGQDCYTAWLRAGSLSTDTSTGRRIARGKVGELFRLRQGHIVHHEDGNQYNNELGNLRVFANQGDHVRHHRGFNVPVLWDGRTPA